MPRSVRPGLHADKTPCRPSCGCSIAGTPADDPRKGGWIGGIATALAALLAPYADPDPETGRLGRLVDVPPHVAAQALALVPDLAGARMNGEPEQW
jgi:hypothetical protein